MKISASNILCSLFFVFTLGSCVKSGNDPDCNKEDNGRFVISNNSGNPYDLYVDDHYVSTIKAHTVSDYIKIKEGHHHKIYVKQASGYTTLPDERSEYLDINKCSDYNWQIP